MMDTLLHDAKRFEALSRPIRLVILHLIVQHGGTLNVIGLREALPGEYSREQSTLSHHLGILKDAGFLAYTRAGNENYYYLRGEALVYCMDAISVLARGQAARVAS